MPNRNLELTFEERVGRISLKSGGRFNTLHRECLLEIREALESLAGEETVRCIIITGSKESFAVGADIAEMREFSPEEAFHFSELGQSLFSRMEELPIPIIGALNGIAMGGGVDLALACDLRVASDRLRIAHPGARLGIITGFGGTSRLPRLAGGSKALEIFMTSETFTAEQALEMGLVDRVFPQGDFQAEVDRLARCIAGMSSSALGWIKSLARAAEICDADLFSALELQACSAICSGPSSQSVF